MRIRMTEKKYFHLAGLPERACMIKLRRFDFHSDLFAQLSLQRVERLFTSFEKTSRQSPAAAGAKSMFQQQHLSVVVEDYRARGDSKARVRHAHAPAAHAHGQHAPNATEKVLKTRHG